MPDNVEIDMFLRNAQACLMKEYDPAGCWVGELSSSALSTAVAVCALDRFDRVAYADQIERGLRWLAEHVNTDGGWGDTVDSPSNLSTTLLCWSAFSMAGKAAQYDRVVAGAVARITRETGGVDAGRIVDAVIRHYGDDRTFSVPILSVCALAGRLGAEPAAWDHVPQLPFELAVFPHRFFKMLRLTVVSYAIPALIAIGLLRHRRRPCRSFLLRTWRNFVVGCVLGKIDRIQPGNGGFLEATPLTAFVAASMSAAGYASHVVTRRAVDFIVKSMRIDGSWPIDTNLSTWLTTLSVNALTQMPGSVLTARQTDAVRRRLLDQQYRNVHPFTRADPGAWSWTSLPGAVPDADDTSGALIALRRLGPMDDEVRSAAMEGIRWLMDLQNNDGGIPAFCRGWGKLPFDRSCPDITAHAMRALAEWRGDMTPSLRLRMDDCLERAKLFLERVQRADGSWVPLWFGNQHVPGGENPAFGTAQVLIGLAESARLGAKGLNALMERGVKWLVSAQNPDGGWGGARGVPSSVEETALAVGALADRGMPEAVTGGIEWLSRNTDCGRSFRPAPIGLYFSALWYYEKLYPVIFTVAALGRLKKNSQ